MPLHPSTPKRSAPPPLTNPSEAKADPLPQNQDQPSPSPSPKQNPSPSHEPNLSGGESSDAGALGDDFAQAGVENQPEPEVLDPELLTPQEFEKRFAAWFDDPAAVLAGAPTEAMRDRAARALHSEISKSSNSWFRALASRGTGTVGNWAIIAMFAAACIKQMAGQMQAQAQQPGQAPGPAPGAAQWPPNPNMGGQA